MSGTTTERRRPRVECQKCKYVASHFHDGGVTHYHICAISDCLFEREGDAWGAKAKRSDLNRGAVYEAIASDPISWQVLEE